MNWRSCLGAGVVAAVLLIGWARLWQGDYLRLGGDEGMEMAKAVLLAVRPAEAARCWTDQPWLYAATLARVWEWSGGSWNAARALSALSALILLWAALRLAPAPQGPLHGLCIAACLASWPYFLLLSFSTMVELPMLATATAAAAVLAGRPWKPGLAVFSGMLAGIACGLKLTAVLMAPAWMLAVASAQPAWLSRPGGAGKARLTGLAGRLALWAVVAIPVALVCLSVGPQENQTLLATHWKSAQWVRAHDHSGFHRLTWERIWPCAVSLAAAGLGLWRLKRGHRLKDALIPATLLLVPLAAQVWALRPVWPIYLLHLAPGGAALGGWLLAEMLLDLHRMGRTRQSPFRRYESNLMVTALLVAGLAAIQVPRAWQQWKEMLARPTKRTSRAWLVINSLRGRARNGFAHAGEYLAQAAIPTVPELTILPMKRFWSGAITEQDVVELVEATQPDLLVLDRGRVAADPKWQGLLSDRYDFLLLEAPIAVYARKGLAPPGPRLDLKWLRQLGAGVPASPEKPR